MKLTRRAVSLGLAAAALTMPPSTRAAGDGVIEAVTALERRLKSRLGISVLSEDGAVLWAYRADERFPMSSTFKALAAAAVLARVDAGREDLARVVTFRKSELVDYSPVTENHVADGMTVAAICEAAITMSDNTAGNLMLGAIGGPDGFTSYMRSIGDEVTRLDRIETALNQGTPGDPRDTTSPAAAAKSLRRLISGDALAPRSGKQLADWMIADRVGDALLRAGLPKQWAIGDKTGAGGHGSRSIIAVIWPPRRPPVFVSVYITETEASFEERNAAMAEIGRALANALSA